MTGDTGPRADRRTRRAALLLPGALALTALLHAAIGLAPPYSMVWPVAWRCRSSSWRATPCERASGGISHPIATAELGQPRARANP